MATILDQALGKVTTTDATPTAVLIYDLLPQASGAFGIDLTAYAEDGSAAGYWRVMNGCHSGDGATIALLGTSVWQVFADGVPWTVALTTDGLQLQLVVVGAAATTVHWMAHIRINVYQPSTL